MNDADGREVQGFCPMGCGQTLFLGSGGYVTCSWHECPRPDAATIGNSTHHSAGMTTRTHQLVDELLDTAAVAQWLGVPVRTLDQWAYRKVGPRFHKLGRHRRYKVADVEKWIADRSVETAR